MPQAQTAELNLNEILNFCPLNLISSVTMSL